MPIRPSGGLREIVGTAITLILLRWIVVAALMLAIAAAVVMS